MTENNTNPAGQAGEQTPPNGQTGGENTPATFTQADIDAAVAKAVTAATTDLKDQLKQIQEANMTEQELAKQRLAEKEAENQKYIASLERETRVNFAQTLLAQNGLPSNPQFAEIYAGFEKDSIKSQIEAQAKLVNDAKEKAKAEFAQNNAPHKTLPAQGAQGNGAAEFTSSRNRLKELGLV